MLLPSNTHKALYRCDVSSPGAIRYPLRPVYRHCDGFLSLLGTPDEQNGPGPTGGKSTPEHDTITHLNPLVL